MYDELGVRSKRSKSSEEKLDCVSQIKLQSLMPGTTVKSVEDSV